MPTLFVAHVTLFAEDAAVARDARQAVELQPGELPTPGARIVSVDGRTVANWAQTSRLVVAFCARGRSAVLSGAPSDGRLVVCQAHDARLGVCVVVGLLLLLVMLVVAISLIVQLAFQRATYVAVDSAVGTNRKIDKLRLVVRFGIGCVGRAQGRDAHAHISFHVLGELLGNQSRHLHEALVVVGESNKPLHALAFCHRVVDRQDDNRTR